MDAALEAVREFAEPAAVVVKHTNPCGVAVASDLTTAYRSARDSDPVSAFGGIVALNRQVDLAVGRLLAEVQRIKSEGDYAAAKALFEAYGIHFEPGLRDEVLSRVARLDLPSYTGFVMPRLDAATFSAMAQLADVMLDSIGWSGNNSTLEALEHDLPVVTLPTGFMRGRHSFAILTRLGIATMAMMMHHDGQPLYSRGQLYGLLNQVAFLRRTGSVSVQVTNLIPSVGSKGYEEPYQKAMVIEQAGAKKLEDYQYDGNHCIATEDPHPWRKQLNIYLAYASFYNPLNFVRAILNWKDPVWSVRVMYQVYGMAGLVKSLTTGWDWLSSLWKGPVRKLQDVPRRRLEMVPPLVAAQRPAPAVHCQSA